ncbi:MAG: LysM peptidoglycan-binding domain-containing protein [Chloroflexi bacterium]|nr:LysM peptidoglycan-binding domain-containing protein [Chloroflexota bacterium]
MRLPAAEPDKRVDTPDVVAQQTNDEQSDNDSIAGAGDPPDAESFATASMTVEPTLASAAVDTDQAGSAQVLRSTSVPTDELVVTHRVVAGDTLTRIAQKYGVSVASLLKANDLPNPDLLIVGQIISLPEPPVDYTPSFLIIPDSRLVRSIQAIDFDIERFLQSRGAALGRMTVEVTKRNPNGTISSDSFAASAVIERVSLEYSVDARILLTFLEHFAGLVTQDSVDDETKLYPLLELEESRLNRAGLYAQLIWLADRLNQGYYGWKYRGETILELLDGSRLYYAQNLNAGTIAVQHALAQLPRAADWKQDSSDSGIFHTYAELFGDPFAEEYETVPDDIEQPQLTLPFPRGETWRFTGGFHGGWGNGSAWAAVDFSPPAEAHQVGVCYTSSYPATAVAGGAIARLDEGLVVLDLDEDSNEGSGWTILYLHVDYHDSLMEGQLVEAGNIIGYPSCLGGFTTATHLHIARRFNGEWLPADCNRCSVDVTVPSFVMSNWKVVGLASQLYQGFMINELDSRSAVAEQGRFTSVNEISW